MTTGKTYSISHGILFRRDETKIHTGLCGLMAVSVCPSVCVSACVYMTSSTIDLSSPPPFKRVLWWGLLSLSRRSDATLPNYLQSRAIFLVSFLPAQSSWCVFTFLPCYIQESQTRQTSWTRKQSAKAVKQ